MSDNKKISTILSFVFFLSGLSALLFETIWFRLAGLSLGNGVWSAAIVTSSFMAGLALGGAISAVFCRKFREHLKIYALLEVAIACSGLAVVYLLPLFEQHITPLLPHSTGYPLALNFLRIAIAFTFFLIPATAMGATLPLLVRVLSKKTDSFGAALGRLYGFNTLGAVVGALIGEFLLIELIGVKSCGLVAALCNLVAAYAVFKLAKSLEVVATQSSDVSRCSVGLDFKSKQILLAAFATGFLMLALEVVWFRLLQLILSATSLVFALMLSIILLGISTGGLLAARLEDYGVELRYLCTPLLLLAANFTIATFIGFSFFIELAQSMSDSEVTRFVIYSSLLMLPVAIISGLLFTAFGDSLSSTSKDETFLTGLLTLFNTSGSMLGAVVSGFLLLPFLGTEKSILLAALLYALCLLLVRKNNESSTKLQTTNLSLGIMLVLMFGFFPTGIMQQQYFAKVTSKYPGATQAVVKEGINETIFYLRYETLGELFYHRMVTNGFSMSGSNAAARRYMKLYTYLPVAIHDDLKSALLISYGVGSTAKSLTDTRSLESIDIVDISKDVLELNSIVYPNKKDLPLNDPRVKVHIEDGRFYLRNTDKTFDLITSEPPPPKLAGVVNLYSREYFQLVFDKLNQGGLVTYWLPVHQLSDEDAKSIIRAFCEVYHDCSLWAAAGLEWMLVGSKNLEQGAGYQHFVEQWNDPVVGAELRELGVELPEQLGAMFMADARQLSVITKDTLPLNDNYPHRLSPGFSNHKFSKLFASMMWEAGAAKRFAQSETIAKLWPVELRESSSKYFNIQKYLKHIFSPEYKRDPKPSIEELDDVLSNTSLETLAIWQMGSSVREVEVAKRKYLNGNRTAETSYVYALGEIASRNYPNAIKLLKESIDYSSSAEQELDYAQYLYLYLLFKNQEQEVAKGLAKDYLRRSRKQRAQDNSYWNFLKNTFDQDLQI